jgi:hypothetical protein
MLYISHSWVTEFEGETFEVNSQGSGLYTKQLKTILNQVHAMLSHHNKVFLVRFDLRQYQATENSTHVSKFFQRLSGFLKRHYKLKRVGFAWVREREKSEKQHYHCFILLDGSKVKAPHKVMKAAKFQWQEQYDGSLCWPSRSYYQLNRNYRDNRENRDILQNAIYHISYLAKAKGKGNKPANAKNIGSSRIHPKKKRQARASKPHLSQ